MNKRKQIGSSIITCLVFVLLFSIQAFADEKISSVGVRVNETKAEAGIVWEAEVAVNGNHYLIEECEWSSDYELWTPGKKITATLRLRSEDGYSFDKEPKVSWRNCEKVSVTRSNLNSLIVKLNYIPRITLQEPTSIYYEDEYTLAWDKVDFCGGYEVKLEKDGRSLKKINIDGRGNTSVDLSEYATDDFLITTQIRAMPPEGKSNYIMPSDWVNFDEGLSANDYSTTIGNFSGSGERKSFYDKDKSKVVGWQYINENWYYFQTSNHGYAVVNAWLEDGGFYYLFNEDGKMLNGWQKVDNLWYLLNTDNTGSNIPNGAMMTGWVRTGPASPWYYLNTGVRTDIPFGAMLTNTTTPDGYYVNQSGEWMQ